MTGFWKGVGAAALALLVAALGAVGGVAGGYWAYQNKDRELDIRMVSIALSILKGDPPPGDDGTTTPPGTTGAGKTTYSETGSSPQTADAENQAARMYAVHLLERYSGNLDADGKLTQLDKPFWEGWAKSGGVPGKVTGFVTTGYTDSYPFADIFAKPDAFKGADVFLNGTSGGAGIQYSPDTSVVDCDKVMAHHDAGTPVNPGDYVYCVIARAKYFTAPSSAASSLIEGAGK